jgi:polyhydroxyalkanoate synthase
MTDGAKVPDFDRALHAAEAKLTGGLSPAAIGMAWQDWFLHLANQPGRQAVLLKRAMSDAADATRQALGQSVTPIMPAADDRRFTDPGWQKPGFALVAQNFLRAERWWQEATIGVPGVSREHERMVNFLARQMLDTMSPSNIASMNPEVIEATRKSGGANVMAGLKLLLEDAVQPAKEAKLPLQPGKDVAITPGQIVLRNELIELIQYAPATGTVHPEPILIIPAWIMKYYILDLSPHNSMVRYLVGQGFTVFCISWRNPGAAQRDMGLDDYRRLGVMAAIDAVSAICQSAKIHAAGYCLGGTLLAITAAAMARDHDERLASLTMLAAQTDFTEAGELQLFINEAQLAFLDDIMWDKGYLESSKMAGAFTMLRSNDLIWSRLIRRYYLGEGDHPNDMMSWDMDPTRMPFRMHSEYLHHLFQDNDLAEGRLLAAGRKISLADIHLPIFLIGTETDNIAPWHSVFILNLLNTGEITFVLTSGGHNAGVVSEPGHPHRHFRIQCRAPNGLYQSPEDWLEQAAPSEGSWWPAWSGWLAARSGEAAPLLEMGHTDAGYPALEPAPGQYILQR